MHTIIFAALAAALTQSSARITVEIQDPAGHPYDAKDVRISADPDVRSYPMTRVGRGIWESTAIPRGVLKVVIYIHRPDGPDRSDRGTFSKHCDRQHTIMIRLDRDDVDPDRRPVSYELRTFCCPVVCIDNCGCPHVIGYETIVRYCPIESTAAIPEPANPPAAQALSKEIPTDCASAPAKTATTASSMRAHYKLPDSAMASFSAWVPERIRIPFAPRVWTYEVPPELRGTGEQRRQTNRQDVVAKSR
jgi:hypothetical protein